MSIVAFELHSITKESAGDTGAVLGAMAAINESLAKITSEGALAEGSLIMTSSSNVVRSELAGLAQAVKASSHEMMMGLNQVRQLAEELCSDLEQGCELALRASSVSALFDELLRNFDETFMQLGYKEEMASVNAAGTQAYDLSKLYSMESERKLHVEVFGGDTSTSASPASEFGDDIELF
jgi:hypothetical protein